MGGVLTSTGFFHVVTKSEPQRTFFCAPGFCWRRFSIYRVTFSQSLSFLSALSPLHYHHPRHHHLLGFTGARRLLAFRSSFAGGKRDERWRRARPRTSGGPRSKWFTKATVIPGLWFVLGRWHGCWCGFVEIMISAGKELFDFVGKSSSVFFQRAELEAQHSILFVWRSGKQCC